MTRAAGAIDTEVSSAATSPSLPPSLRIAIAFTLLLGVGIGFLVAANEPTPGPDRWLAGVAFAVAIAVPALVAMPIASRCPALLTACGVALVPRIVLSFSLVLFPLTWPAVALIWGATREPHCPRHTMLRHAIGGTMLFIFLLGPVVALFLTRDPVSYSLPGGGGGGTSDTIAVHESMLSLAAERALALVVGRALAEQGTPKPATTP